MALLSTAGMVPLYSGVIDEHAVGGRDLLAQRDGGGRRVVAVDLLVVERDGAEALGDLERDALGGGRLERLGETAVDGVGAQAADEDE